MCGIAGFVSKKVNNREVILKMNEQMLHRGPDSGDIYIDEKNGVTLGHRRLAIVDLNTTGAQPMISHSGRYVMVYNGEIYNASKILKQLQEDDSTFGLKGSSDTEVLLEAIEKYGIKNALQMTKGMFAVALYDRQTGAIVLTRDRVGEKPLYYGHINGDFVFASELAEICVYPGFDKRLSKEAVDRYLRYSYVPTPLSIYEGIYKLKPGTYMTFMPPYNEGITEAYYDIEEEYAAGIENPFAGTYDEAVEQLDNTLKEAVRSQLMSDVPLGAFLSGGIDSSTIVALMQSIVDNPVKTFTIGFEDERYDESEAADSIAKHLGTDHTSLTITERELQDIVPRLPRIFSEPMADSSQIPTYLVSKLAKSKVTVSLSGDAGDELFAGYNTYWKTAAAYNKAMKIPSCARHLLGGIVTAGSGAGYHNANPLSRTGQLYRAGKCLLSDSIADFHESVCYDMTYLCGEHIPQKSLLEGIGTITDEMMIRDLMHYHPDDILVKVDRAGMAVSLENRVPMLDKDVLKLAFSLPLEYKLTRIEENGDKLVSKRILKDVLYKYVPSKIMDRPKKGFSVPITKWLNEGSICEWSKELMLNSRLVADGVLDKEYVRTVSESFYKKGINKGLLWNIIVLEQWYREYC
ncbi:MAG: asparagine synthase (glutamine-hydrolyzing) [Lachnospiraceae bacterium]|nr:asparagine synthase (glutamine-hydrolyzing) [Candidatus Colinaster equi]